MNFLAYYFTVCICTVLKFPTGSLHVWGSIARAADGVTRVRAFSLISSAREVCLADFAKLRAHVSRGETVNKHFYLNVLKRLRVAVRRKRHEAWTNNTWMLHHDNSPAHASLLICEFLTKHETTVVPQAPYSPDLAPADFILFPQLKSSLKGP